MFKHLFIFALAVAALPVAHLISHPLPKSISGLRCFITTAGGDKSFVSPSKGDTVLYLKILRYRWLQASKPCESVPWERARQLRNGNDNRKRFKSFI